MNKTASTKCFQRRMPRGGDRLQNFLPAKESKGQVNAHSNQPWKLLGHRQGARGKGRKKKRRGRREPQACYPQQVCTCLGRQDRGAGTPGVRREDAGGGVPRLPAPDLEASCFQRRSLVPPSPRAGSKCLFGMGLSPDGRLACLHFAGLLCFPH